MKLISPLLITVICCLAGALRAQQPQVPDDFTPDGKPGMAGPGEAPPAKIKYVLLMPEERVVEPVKATDRNPFGKSSEELQALNGNKGTTEENLIRERMEKLRIVGVSPGPKGLRVMLGDMVLEPDELVPPVLADQTLNLRVGHITDRAIELIWVEKKPSGMPPRLLTLPLDLRPYVRFALQGQSTLEKIAAEKSSHKNPNVTLGTQFIQQDQPGGTVGVGGKNSKKDAEVAPDKDKDQEKTTAAVDAKPAPLPAKGATPAAATPAADAAASQEPEVWKRAVGLLNNLVKLEEKKN